MGLRVTTGDNWLYGCEAQLEWYMSYKKLNAKIIYVNKNSSHLKTILKQIPNIVNERLNNWSSKKKKFLEIKNEYELIVKKCGYDDKLKYENSEQKPKNNPKRKLAEKL